MDKILVVGTSCTGKTTLAKTIGESLGIPHFDLDDFHFLPNWVERDDKVFRDDLRKTIVPNKKWVVSGSYMSLVKDILWTEVDTIIWLDYPLPLILSRFFRRTFTRAIFKEPCCNGNYESIQHSIFSKESLLLWILKTYKRRKRQLNHYRLSEFKDRNWLVFKSTKQEKKFLNTLVTN